MRSRLMHFIELNWVDFVSSNSQIELFANPNKNLILYAWKILLIQFEST